MGLAYTTHYMDFEPEAWTQISNNPLIFKSLNDNNLLEISDVSGRVHNLKFKKDGKLEIIRVAGKFRVSWNDESVS